MKKLTKEVFERFTEADERSRFCSTTKQKGYIYATNGIVLCRANVDDCDFDLDTELDSPKMDKVIPKATTSHIIDLSVIDFDKHKTEDEYDDSNVKECDVCNGDGEVEWEYDTYTSYHDCPKCDGAGEIGNPVKTGRKTLSESCHIKIHESRIKIKYAKMLADIQQEIGGNLVLLNETNGTAPLLFSIGKAEILVMPVVQGGEGNISHVITKNN